MVNVIRVNVIRMNVIQMNVIRVNVVAPFFHRCSKSEKRIFCEENATAAINGKFIRPPIMRGTRYLSTMEDDEIIQITWPQGLGQSTLKLHSVRP
jgi:hypothetical protein